MFFIYKMSACRKIIAGKVAEKGNQQQRGCSLSRKCRHTRSRCKCRTHVAISVALPDNERRLQAQSAAMCRSNIERSAQNSGDFKVKARKSRVSAFLPRCVFNLAMNEMLHRLSKYDCRLRYAIQPYVVGEKTYQARIRRTALSIYRQQPRIHYNRQWKATKVTKN